MTQDEYAKYLATLQNIELNENSDLKDNFYGYFQCFMPYGKGVENVFSPVPNGNEFYERIKPVFEVTEKQVLQAFERNLSPGYFVPEKQGDKTIVHQYGKQFLDNLKLFVDFLDDEELIELFSSINEAEVSEREDHKFDDYLNEVFFEVVSDWTIEEENEDDLIEILDEAYYSLACDTLLSIYFKYPRYENKPEIDFLKPYFELWKLGYKYVITKDKLILF